MQARSGFRAVVAASVLAGWVGGFAGGAPANAGQGGGAPAVSSAAAAWSYAGATGPGHWAELGYPQCAGAAQSPIDIPLDGARGEPVTAPALAYQPADAKVVNNGHSAETEAPPGSTATIAGTGYELAQIHFHTPSEHTLNGRRYPVEVHFVNKDAAGRIAVIGVLADVGSRTNAAWQPYVAAVAELAEPAAPSEAEARIDWAAMIPAGPLMTYSGSLTTPPCTEGVAWSVVTRPAALSRAQVAAFQRIDLAQAPTGRNNRPIQPRNGRSLTATEQISAKARAASGGSRLAVTVEPACRHPYRFRIQRLAPGTTGSDGPGAADWVVLPGERRTRGDSGRALVNLPAGTYRATVTGNCGRTGTTTDAARLTR